MLKKTRFALVATAVATTAAVAIPTAATANDRPNPVERLCAKQFDKAQRIDMESFRDFDLETWEAIHVQDAITVGGSSRVYVGLDAIVASLQSHFDDKNAVWSWTELARNVEGCKTGVIVYDTTYAIPSIGYSQRMTTSVIYTYQRGKWLVVHDQSTNNPTPAP